MSLAKPTSGDGEQSGDNDKAESITEPKTNKNETSPEESQPRAAMENRRSIAKLQQAINANFSEIQSKAETAEVERLQQLLNELLDRLTELEEDYQSLHNYLMELENDRGGRMETMSRNTAAIKELSTVVFDDNPKCPDCSDGHLQESDSWLSSELVCSNEKCGFKRKMGEY